MIKNVRLSKYASHDKYVWPFTLDMQYTVKSGYYTDMHQLNEGEPVIQPPGSLILKK